MSDGSQTDDGNVPTEGNVKQNPLGSKEFSGAPVSKDPMALETTPAPEGVPEKFWDPIEGKLRTDDLLKSYQSLEEKLRQPKADPEAEPEANAEDEPKVNSEDEPKANAEDEPKETDLVTGTLKVEEVFEAARQSYAETGELSEEARQPLIDMGIPNQTIDLYLQGVKATEAALQSAANEAAGGQEAYAAAVKWAADGGLTKKQILAFNSQVGDVETVGPAVAGLMAAFKKANPGEGQLQNLNGGTNHGDVYGSLDEFQQDLARADKVRDQVARRKAVDKLRRSRAAGTIKSERRQPFGN